MLLLWVEKIEKMLKGRRYYGVEVSWRVDGRFGLFG